MAEVGLSLAAAGLWFVAIVQDLRWRRLSVFVLAVLAVLALIGHPWPWWVLAGAALLWPSRRRSRALALVPVAILVGMVTGEPAPAVALAGGIVAWALSWWGGADGIALFALALRHGPWGLVAGVVVTLVMAVGLMVVRGQTVWRVVAAVPDVLALNDEAGKEIPAETELPAAAALAVGGLVMEVIELWQIFG